MGFLRADCPFSKSMKVKRLDDSNLISSQAIHKSIHYVHFPFTSKWELFVIIRIAKCAKVSSTKYVILYKLITNQINSIFLSLTFCRHRNFGSHSDYRRMLVFGCTAHRHLIESSPLSWKA